MSIVTMTPIKARKLITVGDAWIVDDSPLLQSIEASDDEVIFTWDCPESGYRTITVPIANMDAGTVLEDGVLEAVADDGEAVRIQAFEMKTAW